MRQVQPQPDIFYRIQNVDYGQYLEFPSAFDGDTAEGRILKDSVNQHWKFIAVNEARNTYRIINAAHSEESEDIHYALGVGASDNITTTEDQDSGETHWTILIPEGGPFCSITTPNPNGLKTKLLLQMDREGSTRAEEDRRRNNQRWKIIEVLPFVDDRLPLKHDTYRIRSIDSTSVLTLRNDALTLDPQEGGKNQAWEIILRGNGSYVIKKEGRNDYLSWQANDRGACMVTIDPAARTWIIRNPGGVVHSISPKLSKMDLGLTAVNPDTNEILLTPRENVRNQVWFIESFKFTGEEDLLGEVKRFPAITDGNHVLLNIGNDRFATILPDYTAITWYSSTTEGTAPWVLRYESPTSPYFSLQSFNSSFYATPGVDVTLTSQTPSLWYLAKDGTNAGYYLCPKGSGKNLIWSAVTRGNTFILDRRTPNTPLQMWKVGGNL